MSNPPPFPQAHETFIYSSKYESWPSPHRPSYQPHRFDQASSAIVTVTILEQIKNIVANLLKLDIPRLITHHRFHILLCQTKLNEFKKNLLVILLKYNLGLSRPFNEATTFFNEIDCSFTTSAPVHPEEVFLEGLLSLASS